MFLFFYNRTVLLTTVASRENVPITRIVASPKDDIRWLQSDFNAKMPSLFMNEIELMTCVVNVPLQHICLLHRRE